jgi:CubicO group peptidase (beta-lactamase class C family)
MVNQAFLGDSMYKQISKFLPWCLFLALLLSIQGLAWGADEWQIIQQPMAGATPGGKWHKAASPELMGWDPAKLKKAKAYSRRFGSGAVMIVQDGVVVDGWGSLDINFKCHSVRKSLFSGLIGLAVADGDIRLDSTLAELGIDDDRGLTQEERQATVEMLLKARSGIYLPALGESLGMLKQKPPRGSHAPGAHWYYNNWDFNALGTIYRQETGNDIFGEFKNKIADPIGMQDFDIAKCGYRNQDQNQGRVFLTSRHAYYNFRMSARDLARFGLLYMRGGKWQGRQIIPQDWIEKSLTPYSRTRPDGGYGYMWWLGKGRGFMPPVKVEQPCFMASGYKGQKLWVLPFLKLVIVHRVDSDQTPYAVNSTALGRLLWLILDAAGASGIGPADFLEGAPGQWVDEQNAEKVLGQGVKAKSRKQEGMLVKLDPNGGLAFLDPETGQPTLKGRWHFEDKVFVMRMPGQRERTWLVKYEPSAIRLFDMYGSLVETFDLLGDE